MKIILVFFMLYGGKSSALHLSVENAQACHKAGELLMARTAKMSMASRFYVCIDARTGDEQDG